MLLSPWASGARYLQIPALRAAYSAEAPGEHEWRLFANILESVASGFKDPDTFDEGRRCSCKPRLRKLFQRSTPRMRGSISAIFFRG